MAVAVALCASVHSQGVLYLHDSFTNEFQSDKEIGRHLHECEQRQAGLAGAGRGPEGWGSCEAWDSGPEMELPRCRHASFVTECLIQRREL